MSENVTSVADWKKAATGREIRLPSGHVCIARAPGLQAFVRKGIVPNTLLAMIDKAIKGRADVASAISLEGLDVEKLDEYMSFVDAVVSECMLDPKVSLPPENAVDRTDDVLYTDELEDNDKFFLLQWAMGGTRDLDTFREQQAAVVASVSGGAGPEVPTEPATGS